ncbi:MAG: ABC transporter substrate-binding protein [Candidatus Bipolaricaulia bacterium]
MSRRYALGVVLGLILGVLSVGALGQSYGGTLRIAVMAEPDGLNLILTPAAAAMQIVMYNIVEPLLRYTADGDLVPCLATSYEVENVGSGVHYTFHLRPNVTFHDGSAMTAEDVKYTWDTLYNPATGSPNVTGSSALQQVVVVDPLTVRFELSEVVASFLDSVAAGKGVGIIPAGSDMESMRTRPIGTGPFMFSKWAAGDSLTLVKNPKYWNPELPYLDEVVFKFIPDQAASLNALLAGGVDMVDLMLPENAVQLETNPMFKVVSSPQNLVQHLIFNNARAPFDNVLVRRAINYAIDRDEIITATNMRSDWGSPIASHMPPSNPYYVDMTGMYPHDPAKARELLAQAGYPNGFEATIALPAPYQYHVRTGELIAAQLEEVGIRCKLEIVEWGVWLDRVYSEWDYDMTVIAGDLGLDPAAGFVKPFTKVDAEGNSEYYWQYANPFVRELLAAGVATGNIEERKVIYAAVQTLVASDAVLAWIQVPHGLEAMTRNVMGYRMLGIYVLDLQGLYIQK